MGRDAPFRRRLLVNTAAHGFSMVWLMGLTLATLPPLLHGLGAEAFGIWALIQTFSASAGWLSLADLGVAGAMTRSIAGHASTGRRREHLVALSSGIALLAGVGVVASILLAIVGPHTLPSLFRVPAGRRHATSTAIVVFSGQVFLEFVSGALLAGLEGAQRVDLSRLVTVATRTAQLGSTAVIALAGRGLVAVAVGSLAATAAGTVLAMVLLGSHLPGRLTRPRAEEIRSLVSYGLRVAGLNASGVLHRTMDRLVVGAIVGPSGVALVEIASQVEGGATAVLTSTTYVTVSASPWVLARDEPDRLRELLIRGTKYSVLATVPFVLVAMLLAGPMVHIWVGHTYAGAAGLTALAVAYVGLAASATVSSLMLEGTGHAGLVLAPSLLATTANLVLSIILVRGFGVAGAFVATLLSMVIFVPAVLRRALRVYGVPFGSFVRASLLPVVWPALALAALAGAVVALALGPWPTLLVGASAGLGGFGVLCWRRSIDAGERGELRSLLRSAPASD